MNHWKPCERKDFIDRLRYLDFTGPYSGAKHQFMIYKTNRLTIPSNKEISIPQLKMMIKEVESIIGKNISLTFWNSLKE